MNFIPEVPLAPSKCLSKWIKVDKWDYFQNHPQDFFLLYFNFHVFFTYETIVRSSSWSFEHSGPSSAQWCVLTISIPLGVGQAPVENSWGTYKIKNVAQKKLVLNGTFRLIPYLHKNWSLFTMNLPVQDLNSKSGVFGKCKNWGF